MPRYRSRPKPPAQSGDGVDISVGGSGAGPSAPGFGRLPSSPGERNAFTKRGPGGWKSSQENPVPATHVEPKLTPEQRI
jgi:hypothetical protein